MPDIRALRSQKVSTLSVARIDPPVSRWIVDRAISLIFRCFRWDTIDFFRFQLINTPNCIVVQKFRSKYTIATYKKMSDTRGLAIRAINNVLRLSSCFRVLFPDDLFSITYQLTQLLMFRPVYVIDDKYYAAHCYPPREKKLTSEDGATCLLCLIRELSIKKEPLRRDLLINWLPWETRESR